MKKKITSDHFKNFKMLSHLKQMDGNLYFLIKQANMEDNCYDSDLYQLKDGQLNRLTATGKINDFTLQDGAILFPALRDKKDLEAVKAGKPLTVWYRLTPGLGEALEWKRLPCSVRETAWMDDEHFFFTAAYSRQWEELLASCNGNMEAALKARKENEDFRVFEEIPFWSNGAGDTDGVRSRLYYYSEGQIYPLCGTTADVRGLSLSPEKKTLAFFYQVFEGKRGMSNQLMTLDVAAVQELAAQKAAATEQANESDNATMAGQGRTATNENAAGQPQADWQTGSSEWYDLMKQHDLCPESDCPSYRGVDFVSETKAVVTVSRRIRYGNNENAGFLLWNLKTDEASLIYDGDPYTRSASEGSDCRMGMIGSDLIFDEDGFVMISTVIHHTPLVHVSYTGEIREITGMEMVMEALPADDGYTVIAMVGDDGNEIYHVSPDGNFTALTDLNSHLTKEYNVITPESFTFTNENGLEITGWVIAPAGMERGKKYPTILDVHGGPKTVYGPHFFHEMQYWANEGFAVIFTNPTGGDGRGNEFMDIRGKYGTVDYRDLMTFVDEAIARYDFIDSDRMGVTGGSYGGFMTNWIIGHTDRFKAAASQRSISSWLSFSNTSDIGYFFSEDQNAANAWDNNDQLWAHSPLKYADQAKTPTLFLHSDEDTRCWMAEGIQMFYALKNFNVPARLILFHKETHELSRSGRPKSRIRRNEEITNWMKKWLVDKA